MNPITFHVLLPAILPALFFLVASTPVEVLGCFTRGLLALLIAFTGLIGGLAAAINAGKQKGARNPKATWWVVTALFLSIPAAALIFLA
jgi:hypothetical protein